MNAHTDDPAPNPAPNPGPTVDDLADRVLQAALGTTDLLALYLGDRLGLYRSLATDGPLTADALAARTGTNPRYIREWLEQQAITGFVEVAAPEPTPPAVRGFVLSAAAREVFTDHQSVSYLAPLARTFAASMQQLPAILEAYRHGGGVSWNQLGPDARESQADLNRPWFTRALPAALAGVPSLDKALRRPGARIADIGCGAGWSTLALAATYPGATIHGYDVDAPSVDLAQDNLAQADLAPVDLPRHRDHAPSTQSDAALPGSAAPPDGARLSDRVQFAVADAAGLPSDTYDAVFAFECLHDLPAPVTVLSAARRSLRACGSVVVMDEAVAPTFAPPGDDVERLMYGFSLLVCLPDGMSHSPSEATGTVMRPETLRRYAQRAGLTRFEVLDGAGFGFWRFYRLFP